MAFRRTEYGYAPSKWVQPAAAVVAAGSAVAASLALFAAVTVQPVDAVYALWMGVVCVLMVRMGLLKVEVRREGVHVVNPWRTDFIPWSDFAGFARKRWLYVYPQVVFVVRRSGRAIPVLVLMGGGFFIGDDDSRVDDAVLDLEDRVRAVSTP
jgi:Bacterial PH domain